MSPDRSLLLVALASVLSYSVVAWAASYEPRDLGQCHIFAAHALDAEYAQVAYLCRDGRTYYFAQPAVKK